MLRHTATYLCENEAELLAKIAASEDRSVASLIRRLIREELQRRGARQDQAEA